MKETATWTYDDADALSLLRTEDIGVRFDPSIVTLCARFDALQKEGKPDAAASGRLFALLSQHEEFSPYFPLFSVDRFKELAAQDRGEALTYAAAAVLDQAAAAATA